MCARPGDGAGRGGRGPRGPAGGLEGAALLRRRDTRGRFRGPVRVAGRREGRLSAVSLQTRSYHLIKNMPLAIRYRPAWNSGHSW
ncbi:hypothetical protein SY2F82_21550 [Streptomyces sp. Y2F8-2]|nr:hypothetical protein SY2F82_21550 [Streptomyces sp. Y2F8-2]